MPSLFVSKADNALNPLLRRHFLGGGIALAFAGLPAARSKVALAQTSQNVHSPSDITLGGVVRIGSDNKISLIVPNIEMGQGIYTTEAIIIAEELEVDPKDITVLPALPQDVSDVAPKFLKSLSTGGSRSVRNGWVPLRQAGAAVRLMLLTAAAARWNIPQHLLAAENGYIKDHTGQHCAQYGDFAVDAARQNIPQNVPLKAPSDWKLIGKSFPRVDIPAKTNGTAVFGIDVRVPEMAIGAVMGAPVIGATLDTLDDTLCRTIPGVLNVLKTNTAVAVIARNYWTAKKGLAALKIKWVEGKNSSLSSEDIRRKIRDASLSVPEITARDDKPKNTSAESGKKLEATYELPFLSHAPMEPANVTLHVRAERCDVWMGTQVPTRARAAVAKITGLPPEKVAIHNHMIGGSFGRRLATDFLEQATHFACQVSHPVKFIWSREEDIRQDLFRPAYYDRISATLGQNGQPLSWQHHVSGPSVIDRFAPGGLPVGKLDTDAVAGAVDTPYDLPQMFVTWTRADTPVPVGWWRGVGPAHNVYVVESFIDELAAATHTDPLEYRLRLLGKNPRSVAVLKRVAEESQWSQPLPTGTGRGLALHNAFGSHCAVVTEAVVTEKKSIAIKKVTVVVDCGIAVNTDALIAQMEGGLLFGFSAALYGEITIKNGRIEQSNFHNYPLMRINDAPPIDVHIIKSTDSPGGIGEVGTTAAFPSLGNALFNATGKRCRRYPFSPHFFNGDYGSI
ncbi:molybdopterin-dependent oxidoreductase [Acetobacter senegalensis]|uniref:xanthine dehydrogenase family protein molybdopterin-binding subunit n=1 Tax=Acetobacter senegalensis TaxID=446692 RepID=UPI0020A06851|nr:molybdopterin cofactor-binding domain-containing protein [Acetobacter senegalensis]MCP1195618.1 molybdopterin-dependent oxidoreductase [Acetobacter senegalensis]